MGRPGVETIGELYEAQVQEDFVDGKQIVIAPYEDVKAGRWNFSPESGDRDNS